MWAKLFVPRWRELSVPLDRLWAGIRKMVATQTRWGVDHSATTQVYSWFIIFVLYVIFVLFIHWGWNYFHHTTSFSAGEDRCYVLKFDVIGVMTRKKLK